MKRARTTDRVIGCASGGGFLVLCITVAARVGPLSLYWLGAVLVLAPLSAAALSIVVERSIGARRTVRSRRRDHR